MNISRISAFAVCFAVGLALVSEPSMAKRKNKKKSYNRTASAEQLPSRANSNSKGYPNGRPFQAIELDFDKLFYRLDDIDTDLDQIAANLIRIGKAVVRVEANTNTIITDIAALDGNVDDVADDVTMMKNTMEVQVSVESATLEERNAGVDSDVILYVQVIRNGIGLPGLTQASFSYGNSFPAGAARICEVAVGTPCFEEGVGGMYRIRLAVDESDNTFAGTLMVDDTDGAGTSQVTFDIPAAPEEPAPLPEPAA
jgi:archaellum component FlaC